MDPLEAFRRAKIMKLSLRRGITPSFDRGRFQSGWPFLMFAVAYSGLLGLLCLLATGSMVLSGATFFLTAIGIGQVFQLHTERRLFVPVVAGSCLVLMVTAAMLSGIALSDIEIPQLATRHVSEFVETVLGWFGV